ncbi:MAG: hypothetical protein HGN29_16615 [Asgard group archaeon]|nr:hypothetical protein [Asgard group archaeon]
MKQKEKIPFEGTDLDDPKRTVMKLSEEIIEEVQNIPAEKLRKIVLYTIASMEELYHVEDEKRALCFILKNTAKAFGEEEDCIL